MSLNFISLFPLFIITLSSLFLLARVNWRWSIIALSLQYVVVFWLVLSVWPIGLAAVKLVSGWMAGAVLGSSIQEDAEMRINFKGIKQELRFRVFVGVLVIIFVVVVSPRIQNFVSIPINLALGGFILIGMGLMQIGLTKEADRVILGLLTFLSGFEVIYAFMEDSVMVAGFLAMITLGIALLGAYILNLKIERGEP